MSDAIAAADAAAEAYVVSGRGDDIASGARAVG